MSKWNQSIELSYSDEAFGPKDISTILPKWEEIPEDFKSNNGFGRGEAKKYIKWVDDWFFRGVKIINIVMKNGMNQKVAFRHLGSIMRSFDLKHEHKTAGVAWLMSLWIERFVYEVVKK